MTIRRRGGLTDASLRGALLAEVNGGRRPTRIAVGSGKLQLRATRILSGGDVTEAMQTIVPHVELDVEGLAPDEWELRQEGEVSLWRRRLRRAWWCRWRRDGAVALPVLAAGLRRCCHEYVLAAGCSDSWCSAAFARMPALRMVDGSAVSSRGVIAGVSLSGRS